MPVNYTYSPTLGSKNYERLSFDKEDEDQFISLRFYDSDRNLYEQSIIRDTYEGHSLTYPKLLERAVKRRTFWTGFFKKS